MISFKVADEKHILLILNSLKVFSFAESLGAECSVLFYIQPQTLMHIPLQKYHSYGLIDDLLRLSIGIEDVLEI